MSVCFMEMRACVDVNCTGLGDTEAGGEQRGAGSPEEEPGGWGSWGLDCESEFSLLLWAGSEHLASKDLSPKWG